jgi:hypothetical protein
MPLPRAGRAGGGAAAASRAGTSASGTATSGRGAPAGLPAQPHSMLAALEAMADAVPHLPQQAGSSAAPLPLPALLSLDARLEATYLELVTLANPATAACALVRCQRLHETAVRILTLSVGPLHLSLLKLTNTERSTPTSFCTE